jgi:nitrite reductase/ring-hydroxylating ferredoxin subunit
LSQGTPFDIEDFGIVLSAGILCPQHDWSFDIFTGLADRSAYRLKIWQVEVREPTEEGNDKEVWVRRKPRIG